MKNQVQLITYADRLSGGGLAELDALLHGPLQGLFGAVHILPFFDPIDGADAGFDPIDHLRVDPRLGTWNDLAALAARTDVMADLIVNHISRASPQCRDWLARGARSPWAGLLLTRARVFPQGASAAELDAIHRVREGSLFIEERLGDGTCAELWSTFTPQQIDIDVTHPLGREYLDGILRKFAANGVRSVRADAAGYAIKRAGTSCFMLPETFAWIAQLAARVHALGMELLVETHAHYAKQIDIARRVDLVYDFALPPLVLQAFASGSARALKHWLRIRPANALTVLDTHDGIGVLDMEGLVPQAELDALVQWIHANSGGASRRASGAAAANIDLYQVNCTYFDALARDERRYLLARALQFFVPGVPQVYYVGLLAGHNDVELLEATGVGRDINRHYYTPLEVERALQQPVVRSLCALIRLRNTHPAFDGKLSLPDCADATLILRWDCATEFAELRIDFSDDTYALVVSANGTPRNVALVPNDPQSGG